MPIIQSDLPKVATNESHKKLGQRKVHRAARDKKTDPTAPKGAGFLQIIERSFGDVRHLIECRICVHPMYEPYTTNCGHTFCYGCLVKWFEQDRIKRSCPDCRAFITRPPVPSYTLRDIAHIFSNRAELLPAEETIEEHKIWQEEEKEKVELHRSNDRGLFPGLFGRETAIRDVQDGVLRCPNCTWELEDGLCNACGWSDVSDDGHFSDGFTGSDDGHQVMDALAAASPSSLHGWPQQADSVDGSFFPPPGPATDHESYLSDTEDDGSIGSLDDFIVDGDDGLLEFDNGHSALEEGLPYSTDCKSNASDAAHTLDSDADHREPEDIQPFYIGEENRRIIGLGENDSDSDFGPPSGRRLNGGFAQRTAGGRSWGRTGNIRVRRLARPSNRRASSIVNAARIRTPPTISLDSDSDNDHTEHQRPSRRPRIRRQILSDDDEVPLFQPSSSSENLNQLSSRANGRQSSPAYSQVHRTSRNSQSNSAIPILIESSPIGPSDTQQERERSIPGAFPPSFSYSELSQSIYPGFASRTPSETVSNTYELTTSSPQRPPPTESVSPPFSTGANVGNRSRHFGSPQIPSAFSSSPYSSQQTSSHAARPANATAASRKSRQVQSTGVLGAQSTIDLEKDARKVERKRQKRRRRHQGGAIINTALAS